MNIDIDKIYAVNVLFKLYEKFGENALVRETEHGYHIKIPVECSIDNFIYVTWIDFITSSTLHTSTVGFRSV